MKMRWNYPFPTIFLSIFLYAFLRRLLFAPAIPSDASRKGFFRERNFRKCLFYVLLYIKALPITLFVARGLRNGKKRPASPAAGFAQAPAFSQRNIRRFFSVRRLSGRRARPPGRKRYPHFLHHKRQKNNFNGISFVFWYFGIDLWKKRKYNITVCEIERVPGITFRRKRRECFCLRLT